MPFFFFFLYKTSVCNFIYHSKTPVTLGMRPLGNPAASLKNAERQGVRSRVS